MKDRLKPNTTPKKILLGIIVLLLGALGLEATNNDFDLGKLIKGEGLEESRVLRDVEGNVVDADSPEAAAAKYTDEYNCEDFTTKGEAQAFFENAGGVSKDTNRLDGDKDGEACESLPLGKSN